MFNALIYKGGGIKIPGINPAEHLASVAPASANHTKVTFDLAKLLDNDAQEFVSVKQLAKDGDQLAIDVLCNLAAPYEGTALDRHVDVSKRASDLLADVYSNETAQPAVRFAVGETATAWAERASKTQPASQMYGGITLVAGHHCAQFDDRPALLESIERSNAHLAFIKEEGDNIYLCGRPIGKGEVDTAVTLLNQPESSDDDSTNVLHISETAYIDSALPTSKSIQLQSAIDSARDDALEKGASMFALPVLHQGHYTLVAGPTENDDEHLAVFDSKQDESTPDWVSNIRDQVIYLGGAFQNDDDGSYTHEACGGFCVNGLRHIKQLVQDQSLTTQAPVSPDEPNAQPLSAVQMIWDYVEHLAKMHPADLEKTMQHERFNLLAGPLSLLEENHSSAAVKERQVFAAQRHVSR